MRYRDKKMGICSTCKTTVWRMSHTITFDCWASGSFQEKNITCDHTIMIRKSTTLGTQLLNVSQYCDEILLSRLLWSPNTFVYISLHAENVFWDDLALPSGDAFPYVMPFCGTGSARSPARRSDRINVQVCCCYSRWYYLTKRCTGTSGTMWYYVFSAMCCVWAVNTNGPRASRITQWTPWRFQDHLICKRYETYKDVTE